MSNLENLSGRRTTLVQSPIKFNYFNIIFRKIESISKAWVIFHIPYFEAKHTWYALELRLNNFLYPATQPPFEIIWSIVPFIYHVYNS